MGKAKQKAIAFGKAKTHVNATKHKYQQCDKCGITKPMALAGLCFWCVRIDKWDGKSAPKGVTSYLELQHSTVQNLKVPIYRWYSVEVIRVREKTWEVREEQYGGKLYVLSLANYWGHPNNIVRVVAGRIYDIALQRLHSATQALGPESMGLMCQTRRTKRN